MAVRFFVGSNLVRSAWVLLLAGCGGKLDTAKDGLYKDGPAVIPAASDVVDLTCRPQWNRCAMDFNCCYGPCLAPDLQQPGIRECIGCLPPGFECRYSTDCCGRCSRECDVRDLECKGVCLLALPGDWCRRDEECLEATCVNFHCER